MSENGLSIKGALPEIQGNIVFSSEEIIAAVEKSELSTTEQTVLITVVTSITNIGISSTEKLLSMAYERLIDDPELLNKFIEIIKSISQS